MKFGKHLTRQIVKFIIVGVINTAIDLLVLNVLIALTHSGSSGFLYTVFAAISFLVAVTNSYFMNKYWTFAGLGTKNRKVEVSEFFIVSIVGLVVNVTVASLVVNFVPPVFGLVKLWPSIGKLCGTAAGLFLNFLGYKSIVFEKKKT